MKRRFEPIAVTGIATVSSLGANVHELVSSVREERRGLSKEHAFKYCTTSPLGEIDRAKVPAIPKTICVGSDEWLGHLIASQIINLHQQTGLFDRFRPEEIGIFIGATTAGLTATTKLVESWDGAEFSDSPAEFGKRASEMLLNNTLLDSIKASFPIKGSAVMISTACSSGALAIAEAASALASGQVKVCIAGGFDVLTEVTISGFSVLQVVDQEFCRPLHDDRAGLNLAEGGALFVMERKPPSDLDVCCEIAGFGNATDFHHQTQPQPDGAPMEMTMRRALDCAGIAAHQISYINAHGTGTRANDVAERAAIERLFPSTTKFESTKRLHGHCLGGAGALEAVICAAHVRGELDGVGTSVPSGRRYALSNSFGFGGSCVSLVIGFGHDRSEERA
jgi:3-oxoacyl-[acyl-carrier-protein] synthase-1